MFRVVKYVSLGSAPVLAFTMLKVEASELPETGTKRLVRPKDLPLYREEVQEWEWQSEESEPNALEGGVTSVRQQVWKMADACQGAIDTTKRVYNTVEKTSGDVITYIKTEEGFYPRAGVIGLAGLTGIVLARKGGFFRKTIYSGGLMAATASLCYPYKAVQLGQAEYDWVRGKLSEFYDPRTASEKRESAAKEIKGEEAKTESQPGTGSDTKREQKEAAPSSTENDAQNPEKDFGQSNPADKDLYTTRS